MFSWITTNDNGQALYATYSSELRGASFPNSICIRKIDHSLRFNSLDMSPHPTEKSQFIFNRKWYFSTRLTSVWTPPDSCSSPEITPALPKVNYGKAFSIFFHVNFISNSKGGKKLVGGKKLLIPKCILFITRVINNSYRNENPKQNSTWPAHVLMNHN